MSEPTTVLPIREIGNRYLVERELGQGSTATVYLAHDRQEGRPVAIKLLRRDLVSLSEVARFAREIKITAQLSHPNIVSVLDAGEVDGCGYCVLPYLDGGTLRSRLSAEKQLSLDEAVAITRTLAYALEHAHQQGFVHRDVKPENILFSNGTPYIADFGIVRALTNISGPVTSTGIVLGTPAYMSPEQAGGESTIDGRSDVYSLACVLYEMIAGMPPFVGPTTAVVIAQRFAFAPRRLRDLRGTVPEQLDEVVARALVVTPADRYASAAEFAKALADASADQALLRISSTVRARSSRAFSKRRARLIAGGLATAGIAMLSIGAPLAWQRVAAGTAADTTRIVVFPTQHDAGVPEGQESEFLTEALLRWRGITVADPFLVGDALARRGAAVSSAQDAAKIARSLGAGRYVRTRVLRAGQSFRLEASLFQVRSDSAIYSLRVPLLRDESEADSLFTRVADSLILRGAPAGTAIDRVSGTSSAPALQAFASGWAALESWDLSRADSLFRMSAAFDPSYARAHAWSAQVRDWQRQPSAAWLPLAERALASRSTLSERETALMTGLVEMGRGEFQQACASYDQMRRANENDFAAWFGLGRCASLDDIVIRSGANSSGWAYRSSYHRAVLAFTRAFELLPSVHRGFARGEFQSLSGLFYTADSKLRAGRAAPPDTLRFLSAPVWQSDTLAFVVFAGSTQAELPRLAIANAEAVRQHRSLLRRIAARWATELPMSSSAKEALAVSMEIANAAGVVDTLRAARRLATTPSEIVRLMAFEVLLRMKYSVPDDLSGAIQARALADSALKSLTAPAPPTATQLAVIAAMVGDCTAARRFATSGATAQRSVLPLSRDLMALSRELVMAASMDCSTPRVETELRRLVDQIAIDPDLKSNRSLAETILVSQAALLRFPRDSAMIVRFTTPAGSTLANAAAAALRGDHVRSRQILDAIRANRRAIQGFDGGGSSDAVLMEARVMLANHDTAMARAWLDSSLVRLREHSPWSFTANIAEMGALIESMRLRAALAQMADDSSNSRRWSTAVAVLRKHQ